MDSKYIEPHSLLYSSYLQLDFIGFFFLYNHALNLPSLYIAISVTKETPLFFFIAQSDGGTPLIYYHYLLSTSRRLA